MIEETEIKLSIKKEYKQPETVNKLLNERISQANDKGMIMCIYCKKYKIKFFEIFFCQF